MDDFAAALSAAVGGIASTLALYPLEIVKNNLQVGGGGSRPSFLAVSRRIHRTGGLPAFFTGVHGACSSAALEKLLYYYSYSLLSRTAQSSSGPALLAVGYLSDFTHLPLTMPFEKVMIAQQIGAKQGRKVPFFREFLRIWRSEGWAAFYGGWRAYFVLAFKPAIENAVFERIRAWMLRSSRKALSGAEAFTLGAIARGVATLIVYPASRALRIQQGKKRKKSGTGKQAQDKERQPSLVDVLREVFRNGGLAALYQGIVPDIGRGVLSSALRSSIKERLTLGMRNVLVGEA
jgi:hypothetical protein